jgi:hydrogenase maturation protease
MNPPRILIAGIGNIFLGDDAFGCEVIRELCASAPSNDAIIADFGIRGIDLLYELLNPWELVILIDACVRGGAPGTIYLLEPELDSTAESSPAQIDPHSLDPVRVLRAAQSMGATFNRVLLIACEPSPLPGDDEEFPTDLSPAVRAAIPHAVALVESTLEKFCTEFSPALAPAT